MDFYFCGVFRRFCPPCRLSQLRLSAVACTSVYVVGSLIFSIFILQVFSCGFHAVARANQASDSSHSEVLSASEAEGLPIDSVSILNRKGRTRNSYVRTKLALDEGTSFHEAKLSEGLARLRSTKIFRTAEAQLYKRGDGVHIELILDEKWTTLPDFRFGGGGGTAFFRLGVYDINWFGLGVEGLVSYENRNGTNNGDAWLRWPFAFETKNLFGAGIRRTAVLLTDYAEDRKVLGGEAMSKTTILLDFERPISDHLVFGYRMEPEWVTFNQFQVTTAVVEANAANNRQVSDGSRRILHRTVLRFSNLDYEGILTKGFELSTEWTPVFQGFGSDRDILLSRQEFKFFHILPYEMNLGLKVALAISSDDRPENTYRIGGLTEVRGYFDGQFQDRSALWSNLELRKNLIETWSFIWQPALFYDVGTLATTPDRMNRSQIRDAFGIGLRVIPDFVHLAALRFDYAWGLVDRNNPGGFSFGLLQLF